MIGGDEVPRGRKLRCLDSNALDQSSSPPRRVLFVGIGVTGPFPPREQRKT
ncbi:BZ3500_MvSof-1268-A1-R1_Chr3-3g06469 [Microbotryum saponariae]|uniref:BZ3500_MvSof-1268-A1-R1_Chr3-3g06469 protein n=1 Tax=Microbotryum saponariae TaxID=289078 RepID=A0A2X0NG50_9BASI|nr:BZ3500_MvSof-1268-A1-R1_Chr3-3g06469 [Microbotryum saponariae]SDA04436.1 BZ3501_MvSof-1269-A2-R1_Chr3-2g06156 [Microbotryum saponariae]